MLAFKNKNIILEGIGDFILDSEKIIIFKCSNY